MTIAERLLHLRAQISSAALQARRDPKQVTLIGVAKGARLDDIAAATAAGLTDIGENYSQEATDHAAGLAGLADPTAASSGAALTWHYIGAIQSNKTRGIAENFAWVHTLDRSKIAERLAAQRPIDAPALNVLIQVNFENAPGKSGVSEDQLPLLGARILEMPRLCWRGLMALPEPVDDADQQLASFNRVRESLLRLRRIFPGAPLDCLSMGMSNDYAAAIAAGATHLRIGTALFGARQKHAARAKTGARQRIDAHSKPAAASIPHATRATPS